MNARLDKSGDRILCTRIDCGKELAMARAFPDGTRYVLFGRGWALDGEVWVHTGRDSTVGVRLLSHQYRRGQVGTLVTVLPAEVRCFCGLIQALDADILRVRPFPGPPEGQLIRYSRKYP